jgi:hypothetical protein
VPRTERAITKWCNINARGVTRLDCCYNEAERKYYITPASIEKVMVEERKKFQYMEYRNGSGVLSAEAEDLSEQLRQERDDRSESVPNNEAWQGTKTAAEAPRPTGHEATRSERPTDDPRAQVHHGDWEEESEEELPELKKLQLENYELKVQLEGQKYLVRKFDEFVDGERERHQQEKLALVDRLTEARHQIGTLEQKVLQLEAPRGNVRDAELGERSSNQPS